MQLYESPPLFKSYELPDWLFFAIVARFNAGDDLSAPALICRVVDELPALTCLLAASDWGLAEHDGGELFVVEPPPDVSWDKLVDAAVLFAREVGCSCQRVALEQRPGRPRRHVLIFRNRRANPK